MLSMERGNIFFIRQQRATCKCHGLLLQSWFFYLMQLFSNYRRKTTWHYAYLHTLLRIYCCHYSEVILKPTNCTCFVLKKPNKKNPNPKTLAGLTESGQSARQEVPCFPKIPVPIISIHTPIHTAGSKTT